MCSDQQVMWPFITLCNLSLRCSRTSWMAVLKNISWLTSLAECWSTSLQNGSLSLMPFITHSLVLWLYNSNWSVSHSIVSVHRFTGAMYVIQGFQQSWNCKVVLKSESFSTNVLILTIAQWQFNFLGYLQHFLLFTSYVDPVLCSVSLWDCDDDGFLCNVAMVIVVAPFGCLRLFCGTQNVIILYVWRP